MEARILDRAGQWLQAPYDRDTQLAVKHLMENDPKELEESFYRNLEFGTGGLRGIMGVGTNRMNLYTVAMATQGLANYVKKCFSGISSCKAVISYDCRKHSAEFAMEAARVLAANGFTVYLFDELRPTPELSFAIRELKCQTGIMITASHNPKEYNGYKAYWDDGAQIVAPHDTRIVAEVAKTGPDQVKAFSPADAERIIRIGEEMDRRYLDAILSQIRLSPEALAASRDMKIVYTPLHGTGVRLVPMALERMGFTRIIHVPEQDVNDGDFPTVKSPNPEEPSALKMAMEKAECTGASLILATDPDADRLGIAVRNSRGKMQLLSGNQTAAMLIYYLLRRRQESGLAKPTDYIVKTIVTTDLIRKIAEAYGTDCYDVLTGFKHIARVVKDLEGKGYFVGGGEESYGFNVGEYVRDKDAVISSCLVAEVASWAASRGRSLYDLLLDIYTRFGLFKEKMVSLTLKGKEGNEKIQAMMLEYRNRPPQSIDASPVLLTHDYLARETFDHLTRERRKIELPRSNVLQFICRDHTRVTVRPSGTEPKIKFYFGIYAPLASAQDYDRVEAQLEEKIQSLIHTFIPKP